MSKNRMRHCGTVIVSDEEPRGQVLWANEDYCRLLGYTQQEILQRIQEENVSFLDKGYRQMLLKKVQQQLAEKREVELEYCARTRTGKKVWQLAYGHPDRYEGKRVLRLVVFDITEMYLADAKLKSVNKRIQAIISNMPGGVFLYPVATGGRVSYISDGALEVFGCSREEFFRKFKGRADVFLDVGERERMLHTEDAKPQTGCIEECEYQMETAKGEMRWTRVRQQMFVDADGTLMVCVLIMDVNDVHNNEEALLRKTKEMNELSNSIDGGIVRFFLDDCCSVQIANPGFYHMLGEEETTPKRNLESLFGKEALDELRKTIFDVKMIGDSMQADCCIHTAQGKEMWLSISGSIVEIGNGIPVVQAVVGNITELKRGQKQLEYERERYRVLLSCIEDIVFEYNYEQDRITFIINKPSVQGNSNIIEIDHYKKRFQLLDVIYPEDVEKVKPIFEGKSFRHADVRLRLTGDKDEDYLRMKRYAMSAIVQKDEKHPIKESDYRWFEVHGTAIYDENGRLYRNLGAIHDIDDKKRTNERLRYQSERDPLTQIYNKISVDANINDFLEREGKNGMHALLVLDLDDFKNVNDTYGHQFGDKVLMKTTKVIRDLMRKDDIVGRVGGDEFVILMKSIPNHSCMMKRALDLCRRIEQSTLQEHEDFHLCASVGVAVYPEHGSSYKELFGRADMALYEAKRKGKNQYALYSPKSERVITQKATGIKTRRYHTEETGSAFQILEGLLDVGLKNPGKGISEFLEFLGEQMDASRCYLMTHDGVWREWCNVDAKPCKESKGMVDAVEYNQYLDMFQKENKILIMKNKEEIRDSMPLLYQKLLKNHVEAVVQVQLPQGILGIDECAAPRNWTEHEIGVMRFAAKLLSYCM